MEESEREGEGEEGEKEVKREEGRESRGNVEIESRRKGTEDRGEK